MSRTWKRPEGHGRGVGDWRGKGMEYEHYFRPSRHIGSFRDYYSGNYGYDDDTRFEYAIPRGRVGALGASPNEDRPSRGRIRPNFDSHLRSRSGMRDKGIRRDFERERFYDDGEFVPKSDLFYDDDNSLDDDVPYEGEEERQPEDYIFYLMKCRGDKKKVFTHALAVDKKAANSPEDVSDYVNEQLNSNPNLTSKYGSSIKILKVTLCADPNKWYKSLDANGIDPADVIWVEDEPSTDVEEDIHAEENFEETVDTEAADFNYGDDDGDSSDISFDEFRGFVSEYVNMLIDYNKDGNIGSYTNIMNALKDANYRYINDCPCYDFVASESWDEWEISRDKYFDDAADEAIETLIEIFPNVYEGSEIPSITPALKKTLFNDMYEEIEGYLHEKLGGPFGEENEEFELHPGTFEDLEEGVSEYINGIIEYDDRGDTLIETYDHIEKALNARGYSYTKYCPCKDLVRCCDMSDYNFFYKDFKKEAVEAINLCMDMLPDVYDGVTVDSITPQQEKELISKIHDQIWEYLQLKFEDPSPRKSEDWLKDDGIFSDSGEDMDSSGMINTVDYQNR